MAKSMTKALAALNALPRCTAKSRQTGEQCKQPGTGAGGKCRFHGGASTGRPPTHGQTTKKVRLESDWVRLMLGVIALQQDGKTKFLKPGRLTPKRIEQLLKAKLNK